MAYPYRKLIKPRLGTPIIKGHRLSRGLVGLWLFNEGSGNQVSDLSGNGNYGTFGAGAAAPSWTACKFGSGTFYDGDSYINFGNTASLSITTGSVVIWFNASDVVGTSMIISKAAWGPERNGYFLGLQGDKLMFMLGNAGARQYGEGAKSLAANTWYQGALTWDGSFVKMYVNAVEDYSAAQTQVPISSVYDLYFGRDAGAAAYYFSGLLDNGAIFNRALSASEIAHLYREPFCMFKDPNEWAILGGYTVPVVGMAGAMTTNTGYWGW